MPCCFFMITLHAAHVLKMEAVLPPGLKHATIPCCIILTTARSTSFNESQPFPSFQIFFLPPECSLFLDVPFANGSVQSLLFPLFRINCRRQLFAGQATQATQNILVRTSDVTQSTD